MFSSELAGGDAWAGAGCGCALCAADRAAPSDTREPTDTGVSASIAGTMDLGGGAPSAAEADSGALALLSGAKWTELALTFAFPDSAGDIGYNWYGEQEGFSPLSALQIAAAREAIKGFGDVTLLTFDEVSGSEDYTADIIMAQNEYAGTAYGFYPSFGAWGGDIWFKPGLFTAPEVGNYAWTTMMHEIGHALGLKHGHESGGGGAIPEAINSHEYSIMTYTSYVGASGSHYSNDTWGGPQTLMMLDIAALQTLYGANFETASGDSIYAADPTTGVFTIDGAAEMAPGDNVILRTVWDGGGYDTYDFSAHATDLSIDLAPGGYVDLDTDGFAQRAKLGGGEFARGHVFNALLSDGDERSLIEAARGGAGDDVLSGNQADNALFGGGGDDTLWGGAGDDRFEGGAGIDLVTFDQALDTFTFAAGADGLIITGDGADLIAADVEFASFAGSIHAVSDLLVGETVADTPLAEEDTPALTVNAPAAEGEPAAIALVQSESAEISQPGQKWRGDGADDAMRGGVGDDTLIGAQGDDSLRGAAGDDALRGGAGEDRLQGARGADHLKGGGGGDNLIGGGGDDVLIGGRGADRLKGGGGADSFLFTANGGADRVIDFKAGEDVLDVSRLRLDGFDDLLIEDRIDGAVIGADRGPIALLRGVEADALSEDDFLF